MIEVRHRVRASPDDVFAVLSNGWSYAGWVVGASRIRAVAESFPAAGSRIHHSVGSWPLLIDDTTSVLEVSAPSRLVLRARGWPMGEATVDFRIQPDGAGASLVTLREDVAAGPGFLVPKPLRAAVLTPRNRETLRRLAYLAEKLTSLPE